MEELEYELLLHRFFVELELDEVPTLQIHSSPTAKALKYGYDQRWLAQQYHANTDAGISQWVFVLTDKGKERFFNRQP